MENIWQKGGKMLKLHLLYLICALIVNGTIGRTEKNTTINIGNVDGPPVTRSQVILTANKFARVHWIMSKINQVGTKFDEAFRSPYPLGERIGMAYKWSGWDTVEDFLEKIEQGYGAGTGGGANTYKNYSINSVTGTSCTGLVSRAWHLNHKYTLNHASPLIPRKFKELTQDIPGIDFAQHKVSKIKKGDAFINVTHIILFVYETRDGNPKIIDSAIKDLTTISGQKSVITRAKKAISNFKLRKGNPIGVRVTLRGNNMYDFFDRLITIAIPRIRDFRGFSDKSFDGRGNFNLGIKEQIIFPEIKYDDVEIMLGMDISIVTTAKSDKEAYELLKEFGFPFRKN